MTVLDKLDVSPKTVEVTLQLNLVNGRDFNPEGHSLTTEEALSEAAQSFIAWLDSWCGPKENKDMLLEYLQFKLT